MTGNYKYFFRKIHEYLGLATGLVVFIVAVTGCCWVFQKEIRNWLHPMDAVIVEDGPVIPPTRARELALEVFPGKKVHGTLYGAPEDPIEVIFYQQKPEFYSSIFLHPWTGDVLRVTDHEKGFFHFILHGHMYLWLPEKLGSTLVRYSTLLFFAIILSGLVLWLPKNRRGLAQRLRFKWKPGTRWRRKNFDIHAILGFYVSSLALIFVFTGCVMAFDWFYNAAYKTAGGNKYPAFVVPAIEALPDSSRQSRIDDLLYRLQTEIPGAHSLEFHYPHDDSASIYVEAVYQEGVYYSSDYLFFDPYTLEEVATPSIYGKYANAGFADKVIRMNYDIHVGAIGGLPGKIIAFLASLLIASMPVTGFLLWYGRRVKGKRPARPVASAVAVTSPA